MKIAAAILGLMMVAPPAFAQAPRHNVIIFVADGLRYGSVTPENMPNMFKLKSEGRGFHQQPFAVSHRHHGECQRPSPPAITSATPAISVITSTPARR